MKSLGLVFAVTLCVVVSADYGKIKNFTQTDCSEDTITLAWEFEKGDEELSYYVLRNEKTDFDTNVRCPVDSCQKVIDYLDPCQEYPFTLFAYFGDDIGDSANTTGHTSDLTPGQPQNLEAEGEADVTLTWEEPTEYAECVAGYRVCWKERGESGGDCFNTTELSANVTGLSMCTSYSFSVKAESPSGDLGQEANVFKTTSGGVPGQPQNLTVVAHNETSVTVTFNDPLVYPKCVDLYSFTWFYDDDSEFEGFDSSLTSDGVTCNPKCEYTISPLLPCSNATIGVSASNSEDESGPWAYVEADTEDGAPLPPDSAEAEDLSSNVIRVHWTVGPDNHCARMIKVCWTDEITDNGNCTEESIDQLSGYVDIDEDFPPCDHLDITVGVLSASGEESETIDLSHFTKDIKPDPVTNLTIIEVGSTSVTFKYCRPTTNAQCAVSVDEQVIVDEGQLVKSSVFDPLNDPDGDCMTVNQEGLEPDTDYIIRVRTMSPSGLYSDPAEDDFTTEESDYYELD